MKVSGCAGAVWEGRKDKPQTESAAIGCFLISHLRNGKAAAELSWKRAPELLGATGRAGVWDFPAARRVQVRGSWDAAAIKGGAVSVDGNGIW